MVEVSALSMCVASGLQSQSGKGCQSPTCPTVCPPWVGWAAALVMRQTAHRDVLASERDALTPCAVPRTCCLTQAPQSLLLGWSVCVGVTCFVHKWSILKGAMDRRLRPMGWLRPAMTAKMLAWAEWRGAQWGGEGTCALMLWVKTTNLRRFTMKEIRTWHVSKAGT